MLNFKSFKLTLLACAATLFSFCVTPVCAQDAPGDAGAQASAERIDIDKDNFIEGNLFFVMYHELGHALVSEFNLAVVGREEDAVDGLSTYQIRPQDDQTTPDYLMGAIKGWFLMAANTNLNDIAWWDEHGTSQQRAFNIACLLYGADPKLFKDAADIVNLPEDRRQSCEHDAMMNETSWDALLAADSYVENEKVPNETKAPEVIYKPTEKYAAQMEYLKKLGLLEDTAEFMRMTYKFKPGIKLLAAECGQVNAFWSSSDRSLTMCYELVDAYQAMAEKTDVPAE